MNREIILEVLAEHQQWVSSSCGPEDECTCGADIGGRDSESIAEHQTAMIAAALKGGGA